MFQCKDHLFGYMEIIVMEIRWPRDCLTFIMGIPILVRQHFYIDMTPYLLSSVYKSNGVKNIGQGQRSSHATHLLMLVIICTKYGKNPSRTVDATEWTRFSKSRSNDLEDIGQGQRSSHATHTLMLVIICIKYGKNPSRTVDATERTRFSRPRPNDLEDIGQGQRSLYATLSLILVIICIKYGKNPSRTVDFFFQGQGWKISKIC